jgi:hypothetical protein
VKKMKVIVVVAAVNSGLVNSRRSSMGCSQRRSQVMKAARRPAATPNQPKVAVDAHPWAGASMIA